MVVLLVLVEGEQRQNVVPPQLAERQAQALLDRPSQQIDVHLAGFIQNRGCCLLLRDGIDVRDAAPQAIQGIKAEIGGGASVRFEVCLEGLIDRAQQHHDGRLDSRPLVAPAFAGHVRQSVAQRNGCFLDVTGGAVKAGLRGMPGGPQPLARVHAETPGAEASKGGTLRCRSVGAEIGKSFEGRGCAGGFGLRHRLGQTGVPRCAGRRVEVGQGDVTVVGLASVEELFQAVGRGHGWFAAPVLPVATGDGGNDGYLIAVLHRRFLAVHETNVFVVQI